MGHFGTFSDNQPEAKCYTKRNLDEPLMGYQLFPSTQLKCNDNQSKLPRHGQRIRNPIRQANPLIFIRNSKLLTSSPSHSLRLNSRDGNRVHNIID